MTTFFKNSDYEFKVDFNKYMTKKNAVAAAFVAGACALAACSMTAFFVALTLSLAFLAFQIYQDHTKPSPIERAEQFIFGQ